MSLRCSPIVVDDDSKGIISKTVEDLDVTSSLGGQESTQLLSVTKPCPSSH